MSVTESMFTKLSPIPGRVPTIVSGRVPYEGYQRGLAIEFNGFSEKVKQDPLFKLAWEAMGGRTILALPRLVNLYLLITQFIDRIRVQNIIEFGSFRGGSALFMGTLLKELYPGAKFYALDTFEGMPATDSDLDAHRKGDFRDADFDGFRLQIDKYKLENVIEIHKGLFQDTFPVLAKHGTEFAIAHLDADIYSALKYAQDAIWPCMTPGGYVVYDDATVSSCLGATQAVEELVQQRGLYSEQIYPHFVFRAL